MGEKRESFTNKIGFMLSCVGAAIGLGNIWLFSWKLGKYGGAAFLIPYFILRIKKHYCEQEFTDFTKTSKEAQDMRKVK